jgi:ferrous iron transport protein A
MKESVKNTPMNTISFTPLSDIENGCKVRLAAIDSALSVSRRLMAMGMLPNVELEVINNGHPGPFLIRVRGTRIALGRGLAHKIMVK